MQTLLLQKTQTMGCTREHVCLEHSALGSVADTVVLDEWLPFVTTFNCTRSIPAWRSRAGSQEPLFQIHSELQILGRVAVKPGAKGLKLYSAPERLESK